MGFRFLSLRERARVRASYQRRLAAQTRVLKFGNTCGLLPPSTFRPFDRLRDRTLKVLQAQGPREWIDTRLRLFLDGGAGVLAHDVGDALRFAMIA